MGSAEGDRIKPLRDKSGLTAWGHETARKWDWWPMGSRTGWLPVSQLTRLHVEVASHPKVPRDLH